MRAVARRPRVPLVGRAGRPSAPRPRGRHVRAFPPPSAFGLRGPPGAERRGLPAAELARDPPRAGPCDPRGPAPGAPWAPSGVARQPRVAQVGALPRRRKFWRPRGGCCRPASSRRRLPAPPPAWPRTCCSAPPDGPAPPLLPALGTPCSVPAARLLAFWLGGGGAAGARRGDGASRSPPGTATWGTDADEPGRCGGVAARGKGTLKVQPGACWVPRRNLVLQLPAQDRAGSGLKSWCGSRPRWASPRRLPGRSGASAGPPPHLCSVGLAALTVSGQVPCGGCVGACAQGLPSGAGSQAPGQAGILASLPQLPAAFRVKVGVWLLRVAPATSSTTYPSSVRVRRLCDSPL